MGVPFEALIPYGIMVTVRASTASSRRLLNDVRCSPLPELGCRKLNICRTAGRGRGTRLINGTEYVWRMTFPRSPICKQLIFHSRVLLPHGPGTRALDANAEN